LATDWEALPTGAIARGCLVKQPEKTELRQLKLWSTFNVASRPTTTRNPYLQHPVDTVTPPKESGRDPLGESRRPAAFYETSPAVSIVTNESRFFPRKTRDFSSPRHSVGEYLRVFGHHRATSLLPPCRLFCPRKLTPNRCGTYPVRWLFSRKSLSWPVAPWLDQRVSCGVSSSPPLP